MVKKIGEVFGFYAQIGVAAIKLSDSVKVGDKIQIKGSTTDVTQTIDSMQIEHKSVQAAKKGEQIGIKVKDRVRPRDVVYKVA